MLRRKIWVPDINEVTCITEEWAPPALGPRSVLVKNHLSHISAGTELACIAGLESFFTIPDTPGYTAVGTIAETGGHITAFQPGDRVYTYGPHAEYFQIDTTDRWHGLCVPVPKAVKDEEAAFTHMATIALTAIRQSGIEVGDEVLVTGLGAIGNLAAQLAQLQGGIVTAVDRLPERVSAARASGITGAQATEGEGVNSALQAQLERRPVQVMIDATGAAPVIEAYAPLLAPRADIIVLGSPRAAYASDLTGFLQHFHLLPWNYQLKGALEFIYPTHPSPFHKHSITRNAAIVLDLIKEKRLHTHALLTHRLTPEAAAEGYAGLREAPGEYLGVLIDWTKKEAA